MGLLIGAFGLLTLFLIGIGTARGHLASYMQILLMSIVIPPLWLLLIVYAIGDLDDLIHGRL